MNTFNKYGILNVFNHRKHENPRIYLIFEIITQQPGRNRKTPATRIFDLRRAPFRRYFVNMRQRRLFLSCVAGAICRGPAQLCGRIQNPQT